MTSPMIDYHITTTGGDHHTATNDAIGFIFAREERNGLLDSGSPSNGDVGAITKIVSPSVDEAATSVNNNNNTACSR
jgi:hypothetical protein